MLPKKVKATLQRQHYALIGKHSAIQICRWTKRSLVDGDSCYKEKFYGIKSHECCQMSPAVMWCQNQCLHCWRAIELNLGTSMNEVENPKEIIKGSIKAQKKLLSGFGGYENVNREKFKEAQDPNQFAISLSGEPTLYPKLAGLIRELRKQKKTSFLVTNGLLPRKLQELKNKKALPTQLYVSLNYPNEKLFRKITKNKKKNSWLTLNKTLELLPNLPTRKVIRLTLIKELNMKDEMLEDYATLIKKAKPDFIEVKGYVSLGYSQKRIHWKKMPKHEQVKEFGKKLAKFLNLKVLDEKKESRVVLLGKNKGKMKIKKSEI